MNRNEIDPPHNRDAVLKAIGRAATPPVRKSDSGPSLGFLTGVDLQVQARSVLCVGTEELVRLVEEHRPVVQGVPGMLPEIAANSRIETLVVEGLAFRSGPWIGADDHQSRYLAEEIFEAGRLLRARGGQTWFVPTAELKGSLSARVLSTFTARLDDIPKADLEERAVQSTLWTALIDFVQKSNPLTPIRRSPSASSDSDKGHPLVKTPEYEK